MGGSDIDPPILREIYRNRAEIHDFDRIRAEWGGLTLTPPFCMDLPKTPQNRGKSTESVRNGGSDIDPPILRGFSVQNCWCLTCPPPNSAWICSLLCAICSLLSALCSLAHVSFPTWDDHQHFRHICHSFSIKTPVTHAAPQMFLNTVNLKHLTMRH